MERGKNITWLLYSEDSHTLARVAEVLDPERDCVFGALCADGERRNLMKTDYGLITQLKKSVKKHEVFYFLVFRQEGDGPIDIFDGFPKEKYEKEAKAFAVRARIAKQRQSRAA